MKKHCRKEGSFFFIAKGRAFNIGTDQKIVLHIILKSIQRAFLWHQNELN
jgi:hypothetical protein